MRSSVASVLSSPRAPFFICALGLVLCSPALSTGLTADDYFHKLVLRGSPSAADAIDERAIPRGVSQLFVWADGRQARAHAMMEIGMTGWWTNPQLVMAYFRPLSAATHWLDYTLWPDTPWLMHAHSMLWLLLAWLGLAALYRRVLGADKSVLPMFALLLYVIDDARAMTVAWVANRNALVALALSVLALLVHDRAARSGSRGMLGLASLALLAALLAGESALAVTAYLFAYALYLDPAGVRPGLFRLLPHALVASSWAIAYRALGYGARGSGLVIDPGGHPLWFAEKLIERVPVLLAGQLGFPPSDAWEAYPALASWLPALMMGIALATLAGVAWLALPMLRADARARFFALGALLAAIPVCAQFPHDRLLPFIGIGALGLTALVLEPWLVRASSLPRLRRIACHAFAGLHLFLAPLWLPLRVRGPLDVERMVSAADRSIDDSPAVRSKTVVLMNPPVDAYAGYVPPMRAAQGRPRPRAIRWLATGASDTVITRVDARTLRVRPAAGFLALPSERMQRDPRDRIALGHVVPLGDLEIEVTALTADGRPAEILARFAAPLEDARYTLMHWDRGAFRAFTPPPLGASATLPKVDFASLLP
jgi:hypothetical protein